AGAHVAILDIDAKGKAIAESFNHDVMFIQTDLTSDAAIQQAVADIHQHLGEVSCLVNLACTYLDDGFKSSR
ncbi:SDR family NAD(P)-dependent oxidoreductase, partial [Acinetobacter baumannii]